MNGIIKLKTQQGKRKGIHPTRACLTEQRTSKAEKQGKDLPRRVEVVNLFFLGGGKVFEMPKAGSRVIIGNLVSITRTDPPQQGAGRVWEQVRRHKEVDRRPHVTRDQAGAVAVV